MIVISYESNLPIVQIKDCIILEEEEVTEQSVCPAPNNLNQCIAAVHAIVYALASLKVVLFANRIGLFPDVYGEKWQFVETSNSADQYVKFVVAGFCIEFTGVALGVELMENLIGMFGWY